MSEQSLSGGSSSSRVVILVLLLALAGILAYPRVREYLDSRPDQGDYHADAQLLDKLGTAALGAAPPVVGDVTDWPQWRGPHRDGIAAATNLRGSWPKEGPPVVWRVKGGMGHASLAIAVGRVYTLVQDGTDEVVVCLDAGTGADVWRYRYPARFQENYAGTGPHATPTVADGRVYTVGATGQFLCLDAAAGKLLWRHDLLAEFKTPNQEYGISFAPLIEGDLVITQPGGPGAALAAFNRRDGQLVWQAGDDKPGYSSPMAATIAGRRQVVAVTGESVLGVAPADGRIYWRHPWSTHKECNVATPIVAGDYVFVSAAYNRGCALLEITPDAAGGLLARPVYEHNRMRNHFSTCVLYQDHCYGFDEAYLVCMEFRTGKVLWKQRGFLRGSLLIADGRLIVLGENGQLALADASPAGYRERGAFSVSQSRCWAMPALAGTRLFVRDQDEILCLDLAADR